MSRRIQSAIATPRTPTATRARAAGRALARTLSLLLTLVLVAAAPDPACAGSTDRGSAASPESERKRMVAEQLAARGIHDRRVLAAMAAVPRERFVPSAWQAYAYDDGPLPIGRGQTISQPYVVAFMAQALALRGGERVLEVGSGSGYAAAVLSRVAAEVYGIEIEPELHERSVATLTALGYANVHLRRGDGFKGWPDLAPFDAIVLSCAIEELPAPLWRQLAEGGRVVYPKGPAGAVQSLVVVTKTPAGPREEHLAPVQFVPLRRAR